MEGPLEGPMEGPLEGPMEGPSEAGEDALATRVGGGDVLEEGESGIIGRAVDADSGEGAYQARIIVVEAERELTTDDDGNFTVRLGPGTYTLRVLYDFYIPARVEGVAVYEGEVTTLAEPVSLQIDDDVEAADAVLYRVNTGGEAAQLQVRQQSAAVRDAVSSEEISRAGDSSAASAARRVVATEVVGDYLYVRGLGGRYTSVTLNGALQPQLDPNVPGVQLDLYPSFALASIAVLKSYTPDLPAQFGGGAMQLTTSDYPEEFTFGFSLGFGYNSATTWRDAPTHPGGRFDLLGFDDGTRAIPGVLSDRRLTSTEYPTLEERTEVVQMFDNDWRIEERQVGLMPPSSIRINLGGSHDLGGELDLGYYAAARWSYGRQLLVEDTAIPQLEASVGSNYVNRQERRNYTAVGQLSALGTVSIQSEEHEAAFVTLFNQIGEDFTGVAIGPIDEFDPRLDAVATRTRWSERMFWFNQLKGQSFLGNSRLRWSGYSITSRYSEPDTRDLRFQGREAPQEEDDADVHWVDGVWGTNEGDPGVRAADGSWEREPTGCYSENFTERQNATCNRQFWRPQLSKDGQRLNVEYSNQIFGGSADFHWDWRGIGTWTIDAGAALSISRQRFDIRRFRLDRNRRASSADLQADPATLLQSANSPDVWRMEEETIFRDGFDAEEDLYGVYLMSQVRPVEWLRLFAGLRIEAFRQRLQLGSPLFSSRESNPLEDLYIDLLPAGSVVFEVMENMLVRAGYSETVARPRPRERSDSLYDDYINRRTIQGAPDLVPARMRNADLRWEWFPTTSSVFAVTAFAKFFEDPIELVILNANRVVSYQNTSTARNVGFELEARTNLGFAHEALAPLHVGANFTYVNSSVTLTDEQASIATSNERPMQYQAPWVVNANIGWDPEDGDYSVYVFYNVFGPRLVEVGIMGVGDTFLQPVHSLSLQARYRLPRGVQLSLSVKNILHQAESREVEGVDVPLRRFNQGVDVGLGLSWSYE